MSNKIESLVKMANDISNFFNAESDKALAAEGVKKHILRAWEPRMRAAIIEYSQKDGSGLNPLATEAIKLLAGC
ncbi:Formate dehydrogenase delta subunit [Crenothrix polyspora]|uniref:Formate dehydrogenase delta subunit n=1 Tax=Crenothrix polyspora TaxID=360316 RepID=A0A1R4HFT3_9GAMM|nr:formate dehydrogenase subunit delta [Crenothrix polyspora]SJM94720.1 Formate dehydrogenase delta subunit [Crenothrix polyspora]